MKALPRDGVHPGKTLTPQVALSLLFFVSGGVALMYQMVWQRVLFAAFGINTESVTIIVSVFMFGLGIGALCGAVVQRWYPPLAVPLFCAIELGIGVFGLVSISAIQHLAASVEAVDLWRLTGYVYLLLGLPTVLMGATLPILVGYLDGLLRNVGASVGLLYAVNTLGSAAAALATVTLLFPWLGQADVARVAAGLNFVTAAAVAVWAYHWRGLSASREPRVEVVVTQAAVPSKSQRPERGLVFCLAIVIGFLSLSQEIVWYRLLGFLSGSRPQVFGVLLAAFLSGIALGAWNGARYCREESSRIMYMARRFVQTGVCFVLTFPLLTLIASLDWHTTGVACLLVGLGATLSGGIFPVLCHEAATKWESETGHTVGLVYFANILGATLGPLLTGFWLLEVWPVEVVTLVLSGAFLSTGLLLGWREQGFHWLRQMRTVHQGAVVGVALTFLVAPWFYPLALERLQHRRWNVEPFAAKVQNRAGIITIVKDRQGDIVYGDGAYDGRINLDPVLNSNVIDRAFHIASLHPNPERMLEIGLSTGAWARVMTMYEPVHEFISVEINPGYLEIIGRRPEVAPVLSHPKVKLVIDDGRRWLKGHPQ